MDQTLNRENEIVTLSNDGARRAINYILDLARGRKQACCFIIDPETGQIIETHTRKEIEVERRVR